MAHSFNRKKGTIKVQPRVLVICEDTKSCKTYLEDAARHFRSYAQIEISHCGNTDPLGIVKEAVQRFHAFDHVYCAVDRDKHENFDEAVRLASEHKISVTIIASYPCYEFWLYLHFGYRRKPYAVQGNFSAGDCMVKDLCSVPDMVGYSKGGSKDTFEKLLPKLPGARRHAQQVMNAAIEENQLNPSTRLHDLIAIFEKLGTPQVVT